MQDNANNAADHIVIELKNKGIFVNKMVTPLDQLKNNTIVQVVNEKGYIRYIVYDGLVQTEEGKTIVLIKNTPFQSKRYMPLENFQKEYAGITIVTSGPHISTDMTQAIWKIQENDLKKRLKLLEDHRNGLKASIFILTIGTGLYNYLLLKQCRKSFP